MNPAYISIGVAFLLLGGCSRSDQEFAEGSTPKVREPDPVIVSNLEKIVELRERQAKETEVLVEMGKGANDGAAETALAEARIALAGELGKADEVVTELRNLVKVLETRLKREKALVEDDRRTTADIGELRVALLEAEVRLQRKLIALKPRESDASESSENAPE